MSGGIGHSNAEEKPAGMNGNGKRSKRASSLASSLHGLEEMDVLYETDHDLGQYFSFLVSQSTFKSPL